MKELLRIEKQVTQVIWEIKTKSFKKISGHFEKMVSFLSRVA